MLRLGSPLRFSGICPIIVCFVPMLCLFYPPDTFPLLGAFVLGFHFFKQVNQLDELIDFVLQSCVPKFTLPSFFFDHNQTITHLFFDKLRELVCIFLGYCHCSMIHSFVVPRERPSTYRCNFSPMVWLVLSRHSHLRGQIWVASSSRHTEAETSTPQNAFPTFHELVCYHGTTPQKIRRRWYGDWMTLYLFILPLLWLSVPFTNDYAERRRLCTSPEMTG